MQALASLAGLPSRQADDEGIDKAMYFVALSGVTRYALSEAVKAIIRGGLGHTFFPSPVELRQQCDKAQRPHDEYARRVVMTEAQMRERQREAEFQARKTPEARARVSAAYERFCKDHAASKPKSDATPGPILDPELVARIPDAPTTFKSPKVA